MIGGVHLRLRLQFEHTMPSGLTRNVAKNLRLGEHCHSHPDTFLHIDIVHPPLCLCFANVLSHLTV